MTPEEEAEALDGTVNIQVEYPKLAEVEERAQPLVLRGAGDADRAVVAHLGEERAERVGDRRAVGERIDADDPGRHVHRAESGNEHGVHELFVGGGRPQRRWPRRPRGGRALPQPRRHHHHLRGQRPALPGPHPVGRGPGAASSQRDAGSPEIVSSAISSVPCATSRISIYGSDPERSVVARCRNFGKVSARECLGF